MFNANFSNISAIILIKVEHQYLKIDYWKHLFY